MIKKLVQNYNLNYSRDYDNYVSELGTRDIRVVIEKVADYGIGSVIVVGVFLCLFGLIKVLQARKQKSKVTRKIQLLMEIGLVLIVGGLLLLGIVNFVVTPICCSTGSVAF